MKSLRPLLIATLAALLPVAAAAQTADTEARVIVRFKPQADSVRAKALSVRATQAEARQVAQTRAAGLGLRTGQRLAAGISLDERTHVIVAKGLTGAQLAQRLAGDSEVELVAVDQRRKHMKLPNDPLFGGAAVKPESTVGSAQVRDIDQWYLKAPSGTVVSSVNAPAAWDVVTGASGVVVAVLDSGVRLDHPDLVGQWVSGYDMVGFGNPGTVSTAIANDGGAHDADPSDPGDWVTQADIDGKTLGSSCEASDIGNSSWHGTRVSGLVAARTDNGLGMAGAGWGLKIMPVRVLGKCGGYDSDIMAGMKWAAGIRVTGLPDNPLKAKVLNLSLGGSGSCDPDAAGASSQERATATLYREAITQVNAVGAIVVVAAGNSAGRAVGMPGNCPNVITVAALRHVGTKVGFSSLGADVTIAAPGGNCVNVGSGQSCIYPMVSTTNSGTTVPVAADNAYTGSGPSFGTSFSAPIVSGIVGLMASVRPGLTFTEARGLLRSTASSFPTTGGGSAADGNPPACKAPGAFDQFECYCTTSTCGAGMVNAEAAVKAALALSGGAVTLTESPGNGLVAGQVLTLTAGAIGLPAGRVIVSTNWVVVNGGGIVSSFASSNLTTATLVPTAAGTFSVRADATDNFGQVFSQTAIVNVSAAPNAPPPANTGGGGAGGGGGAASAAWLAGLLLAALALRRSAARR
ncbi:MAG: S8 family serine peptidase [Variovorax sp.]|uniref:S8 family serine peptidase n=1 Tax=Variovorax sp. TaxID=1871043 RepID=UPI00403696DD